MKRGDMCRLRNLYEVYSVWCGDLDSTEVDGGCYVDVPRTTLCVIVETKVPTFGIPRESWCRAIFPQCVGWLSENEFEVISGTR